MSDFVLRIRLNAKYCSGRAVELRMLTAPEYDQVQIDAARACGKNAIQAEVSIERYRKGLLVALARVTVDPVPAGTSLDDASVRWSELNFQILNTQGPLFMHTLFNAKELELLAVHFQRLHEPSRDEMDGSEGNSAASVPST